MGVYIVCLALSNTLGPLLGGYITQGELMQNSSRKS